MSAVMLGATLRSIPVLIALVMLAAGPVSTRIAVELVLWAPVAFLGYLFIAAVALLFRGWRDLRAAEAELLRDRHDEARATLARVLARGLGPSAWWYGMMLLGSVAEARGHFAEAEKIFARAAGAHLRIHSSMARQTAPLALAHRAFTLAALDRLDEAEAALAGVDDPLAAPPTHALAIRAHALVLSRRKEWRKLVDLVGAERGAIRRQLGRRDRVLLDHLAGEAKRSLEDRTRVASERALPLEEDERAWLDAVTYGERRRERAG